jgi:hypothetical protein
MSYVVTMAGEFDTREQAEAARTDMSEAIIRHDGELVGCRMIRHADGVADPSWDDEYPTEHSPVGG